MLTNRVCLHAHLLILNQEILTDSPDIERSQCVATPANGFRSVPNIDLHDIELALAREVFPTCYRLLIVMPVENNG